MIVKGILDEDFVNYKKASMFIIFPYCDFKCNKDVGFNCCQNSDVIELPNIEISIKSITERYIANKITSAIVLGGLEPFNSLPDVYELIRSIREISSDDIVIYTGYTKKECMSNGFIKQLENYSNIIIKYGRYIPNKNPRYDSLLGVELSCDNQYAEKITRIV